MPYFECPNTRTIEESMAQPTCWKKTGIGSAVGEDDREITFAMHGPHLHYLRQDTVGVNTVDGMVASYRFSTTGVASQDEVIHDLIGS